MTWPQIGPHLRKKDDNLIQQVPITLSLLGIILGIYILLAWQGKSVLKINRDLLQYVGQNNDMIFDQAAYYQLISAIFVHMDIVHLGYNLVWLLAFGFKIEETYNRQQYILFFLLTGITGNLLSLLWGRNFISVGASGAIFGLLGIILMNQRILNPKTWRNTLFLVLLFFILTISVNTNILSHLGGLFAGMLVGLKWKPPSKKK